MPAPKERSVVFVGMAAGLALVVGVAALAVRSARAQTEAQRWVEHTHEVLFALEGLVSGYKEVPLRTRAYALTGSREDLAGIAAAEAQVRARMDEALALTRDNRAQQERLRAIFAKIESGFERNRAIAAAYRRGGASEAARVLGPMRDRPVVEIREATDALVKEELGLLEQRRTRQVSGERRLRGAVGAACLAALLGLISAFVFLRRDIQRRAAAERELEASRDRLRGILESSRDFIVAVEVDGRVIAANAAANRRVAEAGGPPLREGGDYFAVFDFDPPLREWLRERWKRVFAGETLEETLETPVQGRRTHLEIDFAPIRSRGVVVGGALVARDVTGRREAELELARRSEELARSNEELERFAYLASHDLKEPLRMVVSYTQLLERRYKGKLDAQADDFIRFAVDGAMRMRDLIDGLLEYSRAGRAPKLEPVDAGAALGDALDNLQTAINECGGCVERMEALPRVRAQRLQLSRVFQNLIANALKFRRAEKPRIVVAARREGREVVFSIADNGIGMSKADLPKIFGLFQRLHTRQHFAGTGLGLAICKKIVESMGGRIWVESEEGKGTTFSFALPAAD